MHCVVLLTFVEFDVVHKCTVDLVQATSVQSTFRTAVLRSTLHIVLLVAYCVAAYTLVFGRIFKRVFNVNMFRSAEPQRKATIFAQS